MARKFPKLSIIQVLFLIFTIAIMVTIFCLSAQDAEKSSDTSSFLTKVAVKILYSDYDSQPPDVQKELWSKASFIVRKLAHFSIYASLGFCASVTAQAFFGKKPWCYRFWLYLRHVRRVPSEFCQGTLLRIP